MAVEEPVGYLLRKSGKSNGGDDYCYVSPIQYQHVEFRFRSLYSAIYLSAQASAHTEAEEAWSIVEDLRAPEGATLTLMCDNPDFNGQPNCAIECCDAWTGWDEKRITGNTVIECLRTALEAKKNHK